MGFSNPFSQGQRPAPAPSPSIWSFAEKLAEKSAAVKPGHNIFGGAIKPATTPFSPMPSVFSTKKKMPNREPTSATKELSPFAFQFAQKVNQQLEKARLTPPNWPADIGNPSKRGVVDGLKDRYKKFREQATKSLRKAGIIDDPNIQRNVLDAFDFKGVCEDMCPEYEIIERITEFDVKEEETVDHDGTPWAEPTIMVKKFGRAAAGQEPPMPMDIRSIDALRRTTDYLIDDLLGCDENLPLKHNYLWDRTRAVRRDFTFHSTKTDAELQTMAYCYETIARFHAISLHLLSQKSVAPPDFEQKQELEQLSKSLQSLVETYDTGAATGVAFENESEFRAYYWLLHLWDPTMDTKMMRWGTDRKVWDSLEMRAVWTMCRAMNTTRKAYPQIEELFAGMPDVIQPLDGAGTKFFDIVDDPRVSYSLACIAETQFSRVRQNLLRGLRAFARAPPENLNVSWTMSRLNSSLRFDTDEEARVFVELHGLEFSAEEDSSADGPYLILNDITMTIPSLRVPQSFSGQIVERKREGQSLAHVIHHKIYREAVVDAPVESSKDPSPPEDDAMDDTLFVTDNEAPPSPKETTPVSNIETPPSPKASAPVSDNETLPTPKEIAPPKIWAAPPEKLSPFSVFTPTAAPPAKEYVSTRTQTDPIQSTAYVSTRIQTEPMVESAPRSPSVREDPPEEKDNMSKFSEWVVQGDKGMLSAGGDLGLALAKEVRSILLNAMAQHQQEREAQNLLEGSRRIKSLYLGIKYLGRWRAVARALRRRRTLRAGRMERAAAAENALKKRKAEDDAGESSFAGLATRRKRARPSATEQLLLASGIFAGVRDEAAAARRTVYASSAYSVSSTTTTPPPKEGWKTRSLREMFSASTGEKRAGEEDEEGTPVPAGYRPRKKARQSPVVPLPVVRSSPLRTSVWGAVPAPRTLWGKFRSRGLRQVPSGRWAPAEGGPPDISQVDVEVEVPEPVSSRGSRGGVPAEEVEVRSQEARAAMAQMMAMMEELEGGLGEEKRALEAIF